jgi:uncharacterized membrane protein YcjF (UPF0283 family)
METAIQVVWWIGLVVALVLTLVILKEVSLVVGTLRDIARLAELTREAARGMAGHLASASRLKGAADPAFALRDDARALARSAGSIERKLAALATPPPPGG